MAGINNPTDTLTAELVGRISRLPSEHRFMNICIACAGHAPHLSLSCSLQVQGASLHCNEAFTAVQVAATRPADIETQNSKETDEIVEQGRNQDLKLGGREMWSGRSSAEGAEGADGGWVWAPQKNFGMFSFEMVHFDAFWSTFRPTIATTMFMTSTEV